MELSEIFTFIKDLGVIQFIMLASFLIILWRTGLLKKNGNGNGHGREYDKEIDELHEHAKVANDEMGEIKNILEKESRATFEHRLKEEEWQKSVLELLGKNNNAT